MFDGSEVGVIFDNLKCWNCHEEYICRDNTFAPVGTCLNCGELNVINRCIKCGTIIETTDGYSQRTEYCDFCRTIYGDK